MAKVIGTCIARKILFLTTCYLYLTLSWSWLVGIIAGKNVLYKFVIVLYSYAANVGLSYILCVCGTQNSTCRLFSFCAVIVSTKKRTVAVFDCQKTMEKRLGCKWIHIPTRCCSFVWNQYEQSITSAIDSDLYWSFSRSENWKSGWFLWRLILMIVLGSFFN